MSAPRPLLAALFLLAPLADAALWGPPAVCHPVQIGDATSLPWKGAAFERDPAYELERVVDDTLALLAGSGSAFVHMETLRRAVIYLGDREAAAPGSARDKAWRDAEALRLVAALAVRTQAGAGGPTAGALAWFDLGYARTALSQMDLAFDLTVRAGSPEARELLSAPLRKAAALAPADGAVHLGVAVALFDGIARDEAACLAHLDTALALSHAPDDLLRRNLLGTMGRFLGASTHEELVAAVRERRQRG